MSVPDKITSQREAFMTAFHAEDIPSMSGLVTNDHLIMAPNRPDIIGLEAVQEFWRSGISMAKTSMEVDSQDVIIAGDVAIDRFKWTQNIKLYDSGNIIEDKGKCIWIWRCGEDGTWRIDSAIWNSDLPNPGTWSGGTEETVQELDTSAEEQIIRKQTENWFAAEVDRDLDACLVYLAPDAVVQPEGVQTIHDSAGTRAFWAEFLKLPYSDIVMEPRSVVIADSGDLAYDIGPFKVVFEGDDGVMEAPGKSTIVWRKTDGEWQCVVMSFSMDAPPAD